jgi:hypothetical protein
MPLPECGNAAKNRFACRSGSDLPESRDGGGLAVTAHVEGKSFQAFDRRFVPHKLRRQRKGNRVAVIGAASAEAGGPSVYERDMLDAE